jgi:hypothetical protein
MIMNKYKLHGKSKAHLENGKRYNCWMNDCEYRRLKFENDSIHFFDETYTHIDVIPLKSLFLEVLCDDSDRNEVTEGDFIRGEGKLICNGWSVDRTPKVEVRRDGDVVKFGWLSKESFDRFYKIERDE